MRRNQILRTSVALAAVTALLGACSEGSADTDDKADKAPSSSPTTEETSAPAEQIALPDGVLPLPESGDEAAALHAGRYHVPLSDNLAFEVDLPEGTDAAGDGLYLITKSFVLKVEVAGEEYGVPVDPCTAQDIAPVGPSVDDLVEAIRDQPIYRASRPEPAELGGVDGEYLEIRIPARYDATPCQNGQVGLPGNPSTSNNVPPGSGDHWWIFDVDGQRVVVQQFCEKCGAGASERMAATVRSITFTPTT